MPSGRIKRIKTKSIQNDEQTSIEATCSDNNKSTKTGIHLEPSDIPLPMHKLFNTNYIQLKYKSIKTEGAQVKQEAATEMNDQMELSSVSKQSDANNENIPLSSRKEKEKFIKGNPKAGKNKFRPCNQQGNLNGFLQITVNTQKQMDKDNSIEVCEKDMRKCSDSFKVSNKLFMSPRSKKHGKKVLKSAKQEGKPKKLEDMIEDSNDKEVEVKEVEKVLLQEAHGDTVKEIEEDIVSIAPQNVTEAQEKCVPKSVEEVQEVLEDVLAIVEQPVCDDHKEEESLKNVNEIATDSQEKEMLPEKVPETPSPSTPTQDIFKLLMDNRNKVIGANSPGRKLDFSPGKSKENSPKSTKSKLKERKAKFEEWSQIKGSNKRKLDELRSQQISNVLESRAKRMKDMLNIGAENSQVMATTSNNHELINARNLVENADGNDKRQPGLMSFFGVLQETSISSSGAENTKPVAPKPCKSFNLSLKHTNEEINVTIDDIDLTTDSTLPQKNTIKEHINESKDNGKQPKKKRRGRKPAVISVNISNENSNDFTFTSTTSVQESIQNDNKDGNEAPDEAKLRRSSRRRTAINYEEDFVDPNKIEDDKGQEKNKKIAPVFNKVKPKPKLDPAALEARNKFLQSGVPGHLKKTFEKQSILEYELVHFPSISHVQQKCTSSLWNLPALPTPKLNVSWEFIESILNSPLDLNLQINEDECSSRAIQLRTPVKPDNLDIKFQQIKHELPEYPVYRCFKVLRERNGFTYAKVDDSNKKKVKRRSKEKAKQVEIVTNTNTDNDIFAMWTEKYKAKSSKEIIGNQRPITKLKKWLESWLTFSKEADSKPKQQHCDLSDFEDSNSRTSTATPINSMIIRGPTGSGKTTAVYAVCEELGINVLELNASSRRTGKRLLQEMQEATQSHQVRKQNDALSTFLIGGRKAETGAKSADGKHKMCVLLIEDVDLVFDQDEGFIAALNQLLVTSKRPIILIATDVNVPHMHKFILQYPVLNFNALSASTLATYLRIMCCIEGLDVDPQSLGQFIEWNKGDVRRTLLQLQFWVCSGGDSLSDGAEKAHISSQVLDLSKCDDGRYVDYNDCTFLLSDPIANFANDKTQTCEKIHINCMRSFQILSPTDDLLPKPLDLVVLWWNLPNLLGFNPITHGALGTPESDIEASHDDLKALKQISAVFDTLSLLDSLHYTERMPYGLEPCPKQWEDSIKDGLQLKHRSEEWRTDRTLTQELQYFLVNGQCKMFKGTRNQAKESIDWNFAVPTPQERRWRRKQHSCELFFQDAMPLNTLCDRAAFALDYYPTIRTICRSEALRNDGNHKRGKRFYHYLRTLSIETTPTVLKAACKTLTL